MLGLSESNFIPYAQFFGIVALGVLYVFGQRWGSTRRTPAEKTIEVAGALVDSEAVKVLAVSIDNHTKESAEMRYTVKKLTEAALLVVRALEGSARSDDSVSEELMQLRSEIRHLGDTLRAHR